ncbi:NAD(P)-dependent oxidoreductase [Chitinilyticum litopenaei]|uniref:NAD(P)-dependent oxidoreductase n=1 Tax=Chitinilyticum litopenaei TaxID=1121276 RepID=UPI00040FA181|nr:NAD(P)-dependent oxidoreductase [Chitinilyticum litopenaei]
MNTLPKHPNIVVTNPIHPEVLARLEAVGRVTINRASEPWTPEELHARMADAHAMMGFMTDCVDALLLAHARQLRIIACALKGFDNYDIDACTRAGVWVSIVPDLLTAPTAELALGLAIALARNIRPGDTLVRSGQFKGWRPCLYGTGLAGATVAVLGLGQVGQAIIHRLAGFGCARIVGVDPANAMAEVDVLPLTEALAQADFIFLAAPLTASSLRLINAETLRHCRPGTFMINVGRGSVVDEDALADALEQGVLAGYAADVFACEDWGLTGRPLQVCERLRLSDKTLLTPHLGSAVHAVRLAIEHRAADNLIAALQGKTPPDAVNQPEIALPEHVLR